MKKIISKIGMVIGFILVGIFFVIWTFKQVSIKEILELLLHGNHIYVLWFLLASLVILICHTLRWKIIIKSLGYKISLLKLIQYRIAGMGISFLTPGAKIGGEPLRALFLKKHGVKFNKGLSTVATDKIIDLSIQGILFVFVALITLITVALPKKIFYIIIISIILIIFLIAYIYYQIFKENNFLIKVFKFLKLEKFKKFRNFEKELVEFEQTIIHFHKNHKKEFFQSILVTIIAWGVMYFEIFYAGVLLGYNLKFLEIFMIITIMGATYLIPIPMALGIFEAGLVGVFKIFSLNPAAGVGMAMIIRTRDIIYSMTGFLILGIYGIGWKTIRKNTDFTNINILEKQLRKKDK